MKSLIPFKNRLYPISAVLFLYYLALAYALFSKGVYSSEGLFFAEKAILFSNGGVDRLTIVGLTFPQLSFFSTWLFSIFHSTFAPFIASAVGTTVLFYIIANSIETHQYKNWLFAGILVTFLFHPTFLFIAVSGKSDYMMLLFFYLFISALYKYFKYNTSYHISVASIYFTMLVFCNFKFIWLALFLLPVIFVAALQSMQIAKSDPWERIAFAFNSLSIRRKLGNKTFAVYLIVFALPLTAIFAFRLLNETYTGDSNYFLDSPYANYLAVINQSENFTGFAKDQVSSFITETSFLTTIKILIYAPMILLCFSVFKSNLRNTFVVFALFLFMEFLKIKYPDVFLQVGFYAAFICMCWGIILNAQNFKNLKYMGQLYLFIIILQLATGYFMMNSSSVPEERKYVTEFKHLIFDQKLITPDEDGTMAKYINNIPSTKTILADDATAYRIIAISSSCKRFLIPAQKTFLAALASPRDNVNYILMPSVNNPYQNFSLLNTEAFDRFQKDGLTLTKVQQSKNWILYSVL
ncbi:hypothetical protein EZ449_13625 [Pedobacter frigidisoli]|uniref:Dolichyl-phosphate-mannose-protein mannosyltransferase n=1 Tax=Pedobacter frigidisoli TaxID=2530455 RepID=A0A4R0P1U8_9SPHI|nr:hypothetical protein [Pedobacter frigidisoli]TCD07577.1 hypothetical protein EZ449_13625 [Pedobacter frigidisoli]